MVKLNKDEIIKQLENLKNLPKIKEVKALTQRLEKELQRFEGIETTVKVISKPRSDKISQSLKKHYRYLRMIRNSFPDLKWKDLRKEFSKKRKGEESNIPDFVWQNPSP